MSKAVLVTGICGGIGRGIARVFSQAGYKVYGIDIQEKPVDSCDHFIQLDLNLYCSDEQGCGARWNYSGFMGIDAINDEAEEHLKKLRRKEQ